MTSRPEAQFPCNVRLDEATEKARRRLERKLGLSATKLVRLAIQELDRAQSGERAA